MLLSKISSRGRESKFMTMANQNLRARKFEHIRGKTLYLGLGLEQATWVAAADSARLSQMRYTGGARGYLEVLTNETNAFLAEWGSRKLNSTNCWLWFSCMKHSEEAGSNKASGTFTYREKHDESSRRERHD